MTERGFKVPALYSSVALIGKLSNAGTKLPSLEEKDCLLAGANVRLLCNRQERQTPLPNTILRHELPDNRADGVSYEGVPAFHRIHQTWRHHRVLGQHFLSDSERKGAVPYCHGFHQIPLFLGYRFVQVGYYFADGLLL